ncbi:MAG: hypothetical protein ACKOZU_07730 [Planctomycetaceae bacterium]
MIDPADLAGLPPPVDDPGPQRRRRPANYLATGERRRLLWRFMPAALVVLLVLTWVERTWFPRTDSPSAPAVDTRLEAVRGPLPGGDAVLIEQEPEPFVPEAGALGAPASSLAKVRDDTFFRDVDMDAWEQTFVTLRETGPEGLRRAPASRVSFGELFGQPRSFRGRLVRLRGTFHRLERLEAPPNRYDIDEYWQGWLELEGGPATPVVVQCLRLPEGMPEGMSITERVEVTGYFFKRYAYAAADTIRVAPLVMALEPVRRPPSPAVTGASSLGTWAIVSMAALFAATVLGIRLAGRPAGRRPASTAADLASALDGHEPFSAAESLRRLGAGDQPQPHQSDRT